MKKKEIEENKKDEKEAEEVKKGKKQAISEKTNENIWWIEEIKKGKQSTEIEIVETSIDGVPDLRLCRVDSYKSNWGDFSFTFVTVERYDRLWGALHDAGFFYKSFHMNDWQIVPIASWMDNYTTLEGFLKNYPKVKDIFREYPRIPRKRVKIEFISYDGAKVAEGFAFFDEDDEVGYQQWLQQNPYGFVLNTNEYHHHKLHKAKCHTINKKGNYKKSLTGNLQYKVCSSEIPDLEKWCNDKGFELKQYCGTCKPLI